LLAANNYPLADAIWTMVIFFVWILWFWLLFSIWVDIFRRHDINGWGKTGWLIFTIVLPFLGAFIYLISQNDGMQQRNVEQMNAQKAQLDNYVRETAGTSGAASEIEKAKALLDSGTITQAEFDAIKSKALAAA
jgi:hypothetical protein